MKPPVSHVRWLLPKKRRSAGALAAILFLLIAFPAQAFEEFNKFAKYDWHFSKYSKRFFGPAFDWRYFKAQAIAESRLKPKARSRVGALGIMQIVPDTLGEIVSKNPNIRYGINQPRWNIAAGIWYDRMLWNLWRAGRPLEDKLNFMFGAYNAGKGNVIQAQRLAHKRGLNPYLWTSVARTLPLVTGRGSLETVTYIRRIRQIKEVLR